MNISSAALRYAMSIADMPNTPPASPRLAHTPRVAAAAPAPPPDAPPAAQWHLQRSEDVYPAFGAGGGMPAQRSWQDAPAVHFPGLQSLPPLPVQAPHPQHPTVSLASMHGPANRSGPSTEAAEAAALAVWRITAIAEAVKRCVRRVQCAAPAPSDFCTHAPARAHTQAHTLACTQRGG